jgi:hypothetical protein
MEALELTQFTIRILLLFLPGVICSFVVDGLTVHKPREVVFFIFRSFVFGFASYVLYWVLLHLGHFVWRNLAYDFPTLFRAPGDAQVQFFNALVDEKSPISLPEIFVVCEVAVLLGIAITVESTYKLGNRMFRRLGVTKRFGELDVWGFAFNLPDNQWVTIRDLKFDLVYDGFIYSFSDDGVDAELLLLSVQVYRNSTGQLLYEVPQLYVSRDRRDITLEFRANFDDNPTHASTGNSTSQLSSSTERGNGEEGRREHDNDGSTPSTASSTATAAAAPANNQSDRQVVPPSPGAPPPPPSS